MKRLLQNREVRNYVHWRWRQNPVGLFVIPWEFLAARLDSDHVHDGHRDAIGLDASAPSPDPVVLILQADTQREMVEIARQKFPNQVAGIIRKADLVCSGRIPLATGIELNFSPPRWQQEVEDLEHLYCLNRWSHGLLLARAWAYTGQRCYVQCWQTLWEDWTKANPSNAACHAWQSYSVSERIVNWCLALSFFWNEPGFREQTWPALREALAGHARWLATHLEVHPIHNHLINNARALFVYGALSGVETYRANGWNILERELFRQVLPDGMLGEQSSHYHLLLTRTYVEVSLIARRIGQPISEEFQGKISQMLRVADSLVRPDGSIPVIGDYSPDTDVASLVGIVAVGNSQLGTTRDGCAQLTESAMAWCDPMTGAHDPNQMQDRATPSLYLPQAGYWIYGAKDKHVVMHADPRATVVRHGHVDALSVCVWANGHELLTDAGNFSYHPDRWREYFVGASAHNLVTVDDLPPFVPPGRLRRLAGGVYGRASAHVNPPVCVGGHWCVVGDHTGYTRLADPVGVQRRVIVASEYVWITDWLTAARSHHLEASWQFGLNQCKPMGPGRWQLKANDLPIALMVWVKDGAPVEPDWCEGWYSASYGHKESSTMARVRADFAGSARLDFLLCLDPRTQSISLEPESNGPARLRTAAWSDELEFDSDSHVLRSVRRSSG